MSSATPIILMAFANDREGSFLRNIAAEQQAISRVLRDAERKQVCEVLVLADASLDDIIRTFKEERGRIAIFHYGGHADGDALHLSSESGGEAEIDGQSFANFLGKQESLELVFLNGCATLAQKEFLLKAGVKRVIITDQAINDNGAKEFATQFYESLSTGARVAKAFEEAGAATVLREGGATRNLYWDAPVANVSPKLPWQYHQHPRLQATWQLPQLAAGSNVKSEEAPKRPKWIYFVVAAVLLVGLGFGGRALYRSMRKSVPPKEVKVEILPWDDAGELVSFTGTVRDQDDQAVDEANVEITSLKDLGYAANREIEAHLGSFLIQLKPSQLGRDKDDSVQFVITKPGYLKTVQYIRVGYLWENRSELDFLLLAVKPPSSGGVSNVETEVVIPTKVSEIFKQQKTSEVLKQIKLDPRVYKAPTLVPISEIFKNGPLLNSGTLKLNFVKVKISMGARVAALKWQVSLNDKEINAKREENSIVISVLQTTEPALIYLRYRNVCQVAKVLPKADLTIDFERNFSRCQ